MKKLNENDLMIISGGSITGVIIREITNAGRFIYSLGQAFGSSLRRISGRNLCPIK